MEKQNPKNLQSFNRVTFIDFYFSYPQSFPVCGAVMRSWDRRIIFLSTYQYLFRGWRAWRARARRPCGATLATAPHSRSAGDQNWWQTALMIRLMMPALAQLYRKVLIFIYHFAFTNFPNTFLCDLDMCSCSQKHVNISILKCVWMVAAAVV